MSNKGALGVDKAAHILMEFYPNGYGSTTIGHHTAFYHEERLYSVRNSLTHTISLVYAASPYEAIKKIVKTEQEGR